MRSGKKRGTGWINIFGFIFRIGIIRDWDIGELMKCVAQAKNSQLRLDPMAEMSQNLLSEKWVVVYFRRNGLSPDWLEKGLRAPELQLNRESPHVERSSAQSGGFGLENLIVSLHKPNYSEALELIKKINDKAVFYKIGLELFASEDGVRLCKKLRKLNGRQPNGHKPKNVFADFKLFDIPSTVGRAMRRIDKLGAKFVSVHFEKSALKAAVDNAEKTGVLAVTALTSLDKDDLRGMGYLIDDLNKFVVERACQACELGCAGVVCSPREIQDVRKNIGVDKVIVTPGIRPLNPGSDYDQKRTTSVQEALSRGADYVIIGREITEASDPKAKVEDILAEMAMVRKTNNRGELPPPQLADEVSPPPRTGARLQG